jgi:DNA-binding PadR family transcriptional regulator
MAVQRVDLPQGTLDLLILRTLALGSQHGCATSERAQQMSSDVLLILQGSLYPGLHRLERHYELTRSRRLRLEVEKVAWAKLTTAVA